MISRTYFDLETSNTLWKIAHLVPPMVNKVGEVLVNVTGATVTATSSSSRSYIFYSSTLVMEDSRLNQLFRDTKNLAIDFYNKQCHGERIEKKDRKTIICEANRVLAMSKKVGGTKDHKDAFNKNTSEKCDRILITLNPYRGPTQVNTHS